MDAASVAEAGYRAMARGQAVVVPGLANRLLVQAPRLVPRALLPPIVKRVQGRRG
jgi:short-subunit dehydrogenase